MLCGLLRALSAHETNLCPSTPASLLWRALTRAPHLPWILPFSEGVSGPQAPQHSPTQRARRRAEPVAGGRLKQSLCSEEEG